MDELLAASLKRMKRNRMIWNALQKTEEEIEAENGRKLLIFRSRKVYRRENFKDSFWYNFMQRDLTDLKSRDGKNFRLRFTVPY